MALPDPDGLAPAVPRHWRPAAYGFLGAACLFFLYRVRAVLPPFIIGLIIAYILDPFLDRLQAKGRSRTRAIAYVYTLAFLLCLLFAILVVPVVISYLYDVADLAPKFAEDTVALMDVETLKQRETQLRERLPGLMERVPPIDWEQYGPEFERQRDALLERVQTEAPRYAQRVVRAVWGLVTGSVAKLITLLFIPITAFYFSREIDPMRARVISWIPERHKERVFRTGGRANAMLAGFFRGQLKLMVLVGITDFVAMVALAQFYGIRFSAALFIALWYGATYCIPMIGATSSLILATVTCFVLSGYSWVCALLALALSWGINTVFDNLVTPRVVGDKVGLHPLTVMFAVFAGYHVLGILGMIIAVPIAAMGKIVIDEYLPEVLARETVAGKEGAPEDAPPDGAEPAD